MDAAYPVNALDATTFERADFEVTLVDRA